MQPPWERVQPDFEWDGSLRDLYVLDTSESHWHLLVEFLRDSEYPLEFFVDQEPSPLPASVAAIFSVRKRASPLLRIGVDGFTVCCHFFCPDQIELDIDPREVDRAERFAQLCAFIESVGLVLERSVLLTHENRPECPFIRFDSATRSFSFVPSPSESGAA